MAKQYIHDMDYKEVIRRLKDGETLKNKYGTTYSYYDGLIIYKNYLGEMYIGSSLCMTDAGLYFETADPEPELKIEVDKFYRTRDGRKAYVSYELDEYFYGIICGDNNQRKWFVDGVEKDELYCRAFDLVSELEE